MCRAGQEANGALGLVAVPYEDTSGKPLWEGTLGDRLGWDTFPPILTGIPLLPEHGWEFFKTDVWHNYHLGLGKHWVASSLVSLLENLPLPFDSMDQKLTWLAKEYREFCKRKRVTPHVEELGRETLSWPQASSCLWGHGTRAQQPHFSCTSSRSFAGLGMMNASTMSFYGRLLLKWALCVFPFLVCVIHCNFQASLVFVLQVQTKIKVC